LVNYLDFLSDSFQYPRVLISP